MPSRAELKSDVFMGIARTLSALSTCDRNHVGAVFVRDGRCISWGFNGAPPGQPHCEENGHGWGVRHSEPGKADLYTLIPGWREIAQVSDPLIHMPWDYRGGVEYLTSLRGCRNATHAELNGLAFAARQGISTDGTTLYVTLAPCLNCARALIAAGVRAVRFDRSYRDESGINLLREALEVTRG